MKRFTLMLWMVTCCVTLVACNESSDKKVMSEERNAQKEIEAAQFEVKEQKVQSQIDIDKARAQGNLESLEAAKIDATEDLADAEKKVDDKKIATTEAISEEELNSGETSGSFQHD